VTPVSGRSVSIVYHGYFPISRRYLAAPGTDPSTGRYATTPTKPDPQFAASKSMLLMDFSALSWLYPIHADRAQVLSAAYAATLERFVRRPPRPPALPAAAWINKPDDEQAAAH
jgi:hypothetical protein